MQKRIEKKFNIQTKLKYALIKEEWPKMKDKKIYYLIVIIKDFDIVIIIWYWSRVWMDR